MYLSPGLAKYEILSLRRLMAVLKRHRRRRYRRYGFGSSPSYSPWHPARRMECHVGCQPGRARRLG